MAKISMGGWVNKKNENKKNEKKTKNKRRGNDPFPISKYKRGHYVGNLLYINSTSYIFDVFLFNISNILVWKINRKRFNILSEYAAVFIMNSPSIIMIKGSPAFFSFSSS